jgi:hypothetical protein
MLAAARAATHFSPLPEGAVIMVLTPSGRSQPGFASGGWCAYHWAVPIGGPVPAPGTAFGYVPYQPDAGGSCGANSVNGGSQGRFDGFSIIGGHEYAEAITDPYPGTGWMDAAGAEQRDRKLCQLDHAALAVPQPGWHPDLCAGRGLLVAGTP